MDEAPRKLGDAKIRFAQRLAVGLGIAGLGGFFALSFTGMMGENYTDFFDEDVSFFEKDLDGESDRAYYWGLMFISLVLAFFSAIYRDTTRGIRNRLAGSGREEFEQLYNEYYGSTYGFLIISVCSVSWETVFETLWVFIALTDMFGVLFVLAGRILGVLYLAWAFDKELLGIKNARIASLSDSKETRLSF